MFFPGGFEGGVHLWMGNGDGDGDDERSNAHAGATFQGAIGVYFVRMSV